MPLDDFIIATYLKVSEFFASVCPRKGLRRCGSRPSLTDEEVLTTEIVGEYLGHGSDKRIFEYFKAHWPAWFPRLGSRTSFVRQGANLLAIKRKMFEAVSGELTADKDLYLFDGFPIPVCHVKRYRRSKSSLRCDGAVGYCAAKDVKHFGFEGHILMTQSGAIKGFELAPANIDERDVLPEPTEGLTGDLVADKGLIRPAPTQELLARGLRLHAPLRANMKDGRPKSFVAKIMDIRRLAETVIGQLAERFNIQSIRAKDMWHLQAKIFRKLLAHSLIFLINLSENPERPLGFENIVQS